MEFKAPEFLWFLILIPALIVAYVFALRRRTQYALRYASLSLVKDAIGKGPGWRRHIPPIFFLLALALMFIAAARPFGAITLIKRQATVILTIDVSGSMRATDLKPNRLEAAKAAARAFIELQDANTRIGVVSFSNMAALVQAPTSDREALLAAVNRLSTQRSTAIGEGILTSLEAIFEKPGEKTAASQNDVIVAPTPSPTPVPPGIHVPATIILLTDGQNRAGILPTEAARVAANRGVRVYTIGVGTTQGATLAPPPGQDQFGGGPGGFGGGPGGGGGGGFRTALDEDTLKRVAAITEGQYFLASDEESLVSIYKNLDKELISAREQEETTVFFTGAAFVFLLLGGVLSMLWFNRLP